VNDVELPQATGHPNVGPSDHAMSTTPESTQNNDHAVSVDGHPLCPDFSIPQDTGGGIMRIVPSDINVSSFISWIHYLQSMLLTFSAYFLLSFDM
jgi:hypothetical protein